MTKRMAVLGIAAIASVLAGLAASGSPVSASSHRTYRTALIQQQPLDPIVTRAPAVVTPPAAQAPPVAPSVPTQPPYPTTFVTTPAPIVVTVPTPTTTTVAPTCSVEYGRIYYGDTPGYQFSYDGSCSQANAIAAEYPGSVVTQHS